MESSKHPQYEILLDFEYFSLSVLKSALKSHREDEICGLVFIHGQFCILDPFLSQVLQSFDVYDFNVHSHQWLLLLHM